MEPSTKETTKESCKISTTEHNGAGGNKILVGKTPMICELLVEAGPRQTLDDESSKLTSVATSKHIENFLHEFRLVLSDDEGELCDPQDKVKTKDMSDGLCSKADLIRDTRSSTQQELPPLPVFPVFSPKNTSPSSR